MAAIRDLIRYASGVPSKQKLLDGLRRRGLARPDSSEVRDIDLATVKISTAPS